MRSTSSLRFSATSNLAPPGTSTPLKDDIDVAVTDDLQPPAPVSRPQLVGLLEEGERPKQSASLLEITLLEAPASTKAFSLILLSLN
jgi:hypothetical protein